MNKLFSIIACILLCSIPSAAQEDIDWLLTEDITANNFAGDTAEQKSFGRKGPIVTNTQTRLEEQIVLVVNNSGQEWPAVKLTIENVRGGEVYNSTNTRQTENGPVYELVHNYPVPSPNGKVKFVVEYRLNKGKSELDAEPIYSFQPIEHTKRTPATKNVQPVRILQKEEPFGVSYYSAESLEEINNQFQFDVSFSSPYLVGDWATMGVILNFAAEKDRTYEIQFTDNYIDWLPVCPRIIATDKTAYWVDKGAPKTPMHPLYDVQFGKMETPRVKRLYRVVQILDEKDE